MSRGHGEAQRYVLLFLETATAEQSTHDLMLSATRKVMGREWVAAGEIAAAKARGLPAAQAASRVDMPVGAEVMQPSTSEIESIRRAMRNLALQGAIETSYHRGALYGRFGNSHRIAFERDLLVWQKALEKKLSFRASREVVRRIP